MRKQPTIITIVSDNVELFDMYRKIANGNPSVPFELLGMKMILTEFNWSWSTRDLDSFTAKLVELVKV